MLINFTVGNYRSFKDAVTLSLEATAMKEHKESIIENGKYKLLPSVVIYGANSSGKSNLLMAFSKMKDILLSSVQLNPGDKLSYDPFALVKSNDKKPVYFEIEFFIGNVKYKYGYTYTSKVIVSEWLYETRMKEREYQLFYRLDKDIRISKTRYKEGNGKEESTTNNRLFLSLVAQLNGKISQSILEWFKHSYYVSGLNSNDYLASSIEMLHRQKPGSKEALTFFNQLNLGFDNITFEKNKFKNNDLLSLFSYNILNKIGEKPFSMKTIHKLYDESGNIIGHKEFDEMKMESEGTKKIIEMSGPIFKVLLNGSILFIDELDAKLHPILTRQIILLFNNSETNKKGAQLIFVTHDTNLLNNKIFRRDQIWFTEKNEMESTDLYSLVEFKDVKGKKIRNDSNLEKNYINGRYGAIPYIKE
ncbi:MAG: ATP-binding protein [Bacteroidales bacterium]